MVEVLHTVHDALHKIQLDMHSNHIHKMWSKWQRLTTEFLELERDLSMSTNICLSSIEVISQGAPGAREQQWLFSKTAKGGRRADNQLPCPSFQPLYHDFIDLKAALQALRLEIKETSNSLTGTMSIIESERAIREAAAVARLTELVFLFAPLSFSATNYGMQIKVGMHQAPDCGPPLTPLFLEI